jgi:hypothetical protein
LINYREIGDETKHCTCRDDVDMFFVINKGWHELSGEWCGHLTWREMDKVIEENQ